MVAPAVAPAAAAAPAAAPVVAPAAKVSHASKSPLTHTVANPTRHIEPDTKAVNTVGAAVDTSPVNNNSPLKTHLITNKIGGTKYKKRLTNKRSRKYKK